MRHTRHGWLLIFTLVALSGPVLDRHAEAARPTACGRTTLEATIGDPDGDGILGCGPPRPMVVREELGIRHGLRESRPLLSFLLLADFQLVDEETPLPITGRAQSALIPHLLNAQVEAANRVVAEGGPVLGRPVELAFALGDLIDDAQHNELRWMIDLLDGGPLVDPDSGREGYDGPDARSLAWPNDLRQPVDGSDVLELANEPFLARGLRAADGAPLPWYAVHGNHDTKVLGIVPHDDPQWREAADRWATGDRKLLRLNTGLSKELRRIRHDPRRRHEETAFWMRVFDLARSGAASVADDVRRVPADARRRMVSKQDWIDELSTTAGLPVGHGFGAGSRRCPDVYPDDHSRRACYSFDRGSFRFIALDDNALHGYESGSIDPAQFAWLDRELRAASTSYYDDAGRLVSNRGGRDRYVVVLSHHTSDGQSNPGAGEHTGDDLERLLLRFPNVIVHANGHTHRNRLLPHRRGKSGYWEINTASVADHPNGGRVIEIADNGDGTLSIYAVAFETSVHPDPRKIRWTTDDPTDERIAGAERMVNEDLLAATGIELASLFRDPRRYVRAADRNAELVLPAPFHGPQPSRTPAPARSSSTLIAFTAGGVVLSATGGLAARRRRRTPNRIPLLRPRSAGAGRRRRERAPVRR